MAYFLEFDVDQHKVTVDGAVWDADFIVPKLKLIIEFDGSFWHQNRQILDRKKTRILTDAGWTVIRLREKPLRPLTKNDIVVPQALTEETIKQVTVSALKKIEKVTRKKIKKLQWYKRHDGLVSDEQAKNYINGVLERRAHRGRAPP